MVGEGCLGPAQLVEQMLTLWQSGTVREHGQVSVGCRLLLQLLHPEGEDVHGSVKPFFLPLMSFH